MKIQHAKHTIVAVAYLWALSISSVTALPKLRLVPYGKGFDRINTDEICEKDIWPHWAATFTNRGAKVPVVSTGAKLFRRTNEIAVSCFDTRNDLDLSVEDKEAGKWNLVCEISTEIAVKYLEPDGNKKLHKKGRCELLAPPWEQEVSAGTTDCGTTSSVYQMRYVSAWTTASDHTPEVHLVNSMITISEVNGPVLGTSESGPYVAIDDSDLKSSTTRKRQYRVCASAPPGRGQLYMHFAYSGH